MYVCFIILLYDYVVVICICNILIFLRLDVRVELIFCEGSRGCWVKLLKNVCLFWNKLIFGINVYVYGM